MNEVWVEICKLPIEQKWLMLFKMYAHLSKRIDTKMTFCELMKSVDNAVNDVLKTHNDEE